MMNRLPSFCKYKGATQHGSRFLFLCMVMAIVGFHGILSAEGTKQLEPNGAPAKSVCKIALSQSAIEFRIPFALLNCGEDFRMNVRINDAASEKIYLGFGDVINYSDETITYQDVKFQVKDPTGKIVTGFSLTQLPAPGSTGYIRSRSQVDAGPDINNLNPQGYIPLVLTPGMTGDYIIEFQIPNSSQSGSGINEMRELKYFDVTVAKGNSPVPGRLWSKAWQLSSGSVISDTSASYSLFYIYTSDSIVTRFDCNGLAGGVWSIYSNEWGCSTVGNWNDRRQSVRGNASVQPQYKIFLNDPDPSVFPSGHIGQLVDFEQVTKECDTVVAFSADVSKAGNIGILLDAYPYDNTGLEDVRLNYPVNAGHNILLPAWDGKDGNGVPLENETEVNVKISFLNGLSNLPLYDVEDNPRGFKVDIERPMPASGESKLKVFWDDSQLPYRFFPTSNTTDGCVYSGTEPYSGCHSWTRFQGLGDTNTINSWWYLTTDQVLEKTITLKFKPSSGYIGGPVNICSGQTVSFNTKAIPFANKYIWQLSAPGFSNDSVSAPDTTISYKFNTSIPAGEYTVSVQGWNPQCREGEIVNYKARVHNRPQADYINENPCQGAGIIFTDQSIVSDAALDIFSWTVSSDQGDERAFQGNPVLIVFDTVTNYTVRHTIADLYGCSDTVSKTITIKPKPNSSFEIIEHTGVNNGELNFDNQTPDASAYLWDFGNSTTSTLFEPFIKYNLEGDYTIILIATNQEGCKDTTTRQYYYMPGLWMPNAFSPDNDGNNDIFRPVTQRNSLDPYQLLVYDRWGQLIFWSSIPSIGWDGTINGEPCPAGSYNYLIQYRDAKEEGSEVVTKRGMVSLVR
jgi:gliding motility-associated-like protein